jgi:hypothetical protein
MMPCVILTALTLPGAFIVVQVLRGYYSKEREHDV